MQRPCSHSCLSPNPIIKSIFLIKYTRRIVPRKNPFFFSMFSSLRYFPCTHLRTYGHTRTSYTSYPRILAHPHTGTRASHPVGTNKNPINVLYFVKSACQLRVLVLYLSQLIRVHTSINIYIYIIIQYIYIVLLQLSFVQYTRTIISCIISMCVFYIFLICICIYIYMYVYIMCFPFSVCSM